MATKYEIEKFNGSNFSLWKMRIKAVLRKDNCLAAIGDRPDEITDDGKWNEMDGNAIANLHLALADGVLSSVAEKKTAKEIWDTLTKLYEAKSLHNKIFLRRRLYTLRMMESTMVTDHINTLNTLFSQLTAMGHNIETGERAEILLQSLPDSYDQLIINLTNNIEVLVFDDIAAAVLEEESRRKSKEDRLGGSQQAEALTMTRGRSTERGPSGSQNQSRSKSRSKKNVKCHHCGKKGHYKRECWHLKKNEEAKGKGPESSKAQGCVASTSDDGEILYSEATTVTEGRRRFADVWLMDSGATWHMTPRREWFHQYEPISGGSVFMGDDHALEIAGIGTIKLKMCDGMVRTIQEVRHVKGLKKNLLSLGQLDNNGCKTHIQNGIMKIVKGALVMMKAEKIAANLYMLKGKTQQEGEASTALASSAEELTMMWHRKLGHMSERGLKILAEQKLLPGLKKVSLPFCEHCVTSKQHRLKFSSSSARSKAILELIHSDVWQAPVLSLGGAKYFVSFIDDYSRRCWVYPIKNKADVFPVFKIFKARVELESEKKIKCLRTDNGGEYTSVEFDSFCQQEGIKRQFTVAYTPQQNGVAERMNRTLLERTRAMLRTAGMAKTFWAEAVKTACYVINRSPSTAIDLKTPMEMWTGKPADYSHLHTFGSPVYVMYNAQETSKLDPKSRKCVFLGYADGVKGYRLWDPTARKVLISRDVIFVEDKVQEKENDSTSKEKPKTATVQVEESQEQEVPDSSEAASEHEEQEQAEFATPQVRRSTRERREPAWHSEYIMEGNVAYCLLTEDGEPSTFHEATKSQEAPMWMVAMQEEIEALHKNKTWDLVPLPQGRKAIGNKWVYKIKRDGNDQVERYRARLVVKGFAQKEGIDFNEIFSPVVRLTTVRVVLAMCATFDLYLEQLDVKTAFLHGELEEEIYMLQPEGFEEKGKENLVCKLNKSLYGLKQAPRCWYKRFDSFIMSLGYNRHSSDPCVYYKRFGDGNFIILLLYVDDMLVAGPNKDRITDLKAQLAREFEMKDLGPANKILGMQIYRDRNNRKIWLSQKNYLKKILRRFNMQDCKPIPTPLPINFKLSSSMSPSNEAERMEMSRVPYASAVGSLMFAMVCTRPDIAQAVGVVSRYMVNPGKEHWSAVKRILRYVKGTSNVALCYGGSDFTVRGYVDSDYAGDLDKSKSTSGYVFTLAGGAVSWVSKLQSIVATSTTEAEYVAATQASKEAIWLQMLLEELGHKQEKIALFCDSQSALHLAKNPAFHSKTKHIRVQYHFVREKVEEGSVDIQKIHTKDNLADMLTKPINNDKFIWCRSSLGLADT
uniref:Gag-Pol polyprotein n=1 Tax=Fagus sylvatica TaxID=28930 RepID=A0A2N9GLP2_FAGSY